MKKIITLLYLGISLISCAQKEIKIEDIMNQDNVQKVANIYKEVKTYDYNPQYKLHITKAANFSFEILINDFPVLYKYETGITTGSIPINEAILKSGKQKLTVRMTPPVDNQFNMAKEIDLAIAELKLTIEYGDHAVEKYKDFKTALSYEMPKMINKLPYYEINLEFEAPKVPYENAIKGWAKGADILKEDKKVLQKEVETFYKEMIGFYENKNIDALAGKYYKMQKEIAQAHYLNKAEDSQIVVDAWIKNINDERAFIFNDYAMKFYGNGRIVVLKKTDKKYFDFSALTRESKEGSYQEYIMFLYRPSPGAPLEVIR